MEVLQVSALLWQSVEAVVVIGVTVVARIHQYLLTVSFREPMVVQVAVLVADFLTLSVETLQLNRCQSVQRHTETRVATQSVEPIITVPVVAVLALPVRIGQPRTYCQLQAELV
jgi:hypothetical protein